MSIRWRRLSPLLVPVFLTVVFTAYVYAQPTTRCVIVNESQQTTIKASGSRCTNLSAEEEVVVFTRDGVYGVTNDAE